MEWQGRPKSDNIEIAKQLWVHVQDKSRRQRGIKDRDATADYLRATTHPTGLNFTGAGDMAGLNLSQVSNEDWRSVLGAAAASDAGQEAAPAVRGMPPLNPKPVDKGPIGNAMNFTKDVLSNFNDKASFGLYPKLLDFVNGGGSHYQDDVAASEKNDPIASVMGSTLGYMVPGAGIDSAVTRIAPKLAVNTAKALAMRGAADNTIQRVTDDTMRGNNPDPAGVAIDAGLGAVTGPFMHALEWAASPKARIRSMGTTLSDADKGQIQNTMVKAGGLGVPLNVPEAATATIPGKTQDIQAAYQTALQSPKGSIAAATFDANRRPIIQAAGRDAVANLGGGIDPIDASGVAQLALKNDKMAGQAAVDPLYSAVGPRKVPPTWVPRTPGVQEAMSDVTGNAVTQAGLSQDLGRPVMPNDIANLDAVQKRMGGIVGQTIDTDPAMAKYTKREREALIAKMDSVAPDYAAARSQSEGYLANNERLGQGPLGTVAATPRTGTQGDALFGVTTGADANNAAEAIDKMDMTQPGAPKGILANRIDDAVSNDPLTFGKQALPNEYSENLARLAAGANGMDAISPVLEASKHVQPAPPPFAAPGGEGPWSAGYSRLRNYGRGPVVQGLQDPASLDLMGVESPLHYGLTLTGNGITQAATERRVRNRQGG